MKCKLCEKEIKDYSEKYNHLKIDENHEYDICLDCAVKVVKWQGDVFMDLFPTKLAKRRKERK